MGHIRLLDYFESLKKGTSEKCTTISKKALKHPKRPKWPEVPKKYKEVQRAKTVGNGKRKKPKFAGKRPEKRQTSSKWLNMVQKDWKARRCPTQKKLDETSFAAFAFV